MGGALIRYRAAAPSLFGVSCLVGLLAFDAGDARAQKSGLGGIVIDSAGAPIKDANVGIIALRQLARTDEQGRFAFTKVPIGEHELSVRRLGYQPRTVVVVVTPSPIDSVSVTLLAQPAVLSEVSVSASEFRLRQGIEDFYQRRVRGLGVYVTREQIEKRHPSTTSDMLRSLPGIRVVRLRGGGQGVRFMSSAVARRDCMPMIWVDGQRAPEVEIDQLTVRDIEGIELYNGPATTPMQFSQGPDVAACGTIVVWSKRPGG